MEGISILGSCVFRCRRLGRKFPKSRCHEEVIGGLCRVNSLKGLYRGLYPRSIVGVIKGHARSSDKSSYGPYIAFT